jgi:hypothetical protein
MRHAEAILASDRKRKQRVTKSGPFKQLKDEVETLRAMVTALESEVADWQGIARRLALNSAHQLLDTPNALRQEGLALWRAHFELVNRKPLKPGQTDRGPTKQELALARDELHKTELALPHRDPTTRELQIGSKLRTKVQDHAVAAFVTVAMEAIARGEALPQDESGQHWRCRKDTIGNAAKAFGVTERTIEEALARHRASEANSKSPQ